MAILHTTWPGKKMASPAPVKKRQEIKNPEKKIKKEKPVIEQVSVIAEPSIEEFLNNENI